QSRAEQSRAEQSRAEQSRAEQSRAEQSRAEQSRADQSRAEQSRAEQSRAEQSRAETVLRYYKQWKEYKKIRNVFKKYLPKMLAELESIKADLGERKEELFTIFKYYLERQATVYKKLRFARMQKVAREIEKKRPKIIDESIKSLKVKDSGLPYSVLDFNGLVIPDLTNTRAVYGEKATPLSYYDYFSSLADTGFQTILRLDPEKKYYFYDSLPEGPYEYSKAKINKGDTVFNIGADYGFESAAAALKGAGEIYAFEPIKLNIETRIKFIAEVSERFYGKKIHIVPMAISDEISEGTIQLASGTTALVYHKCVSGEVKRGIEVNFKTTTLDRFVTENNIKKVDYITADIEGYERKMLKGAKNVLKDFGPKLAICTYHLPDDPEVLESLVREANPKYIIEHKYKKMYAYIPKN
ncbi:MAG: FkbM family methyltransferase, partial [Clostridiales Family XIII bacterium]|nr:FkbM family methyltransferase [Clostridiales Family XIII bacterium]